jgi:hypothetical protein
MSFIPALPSDLASRLLEAECWRVGIIARPDPDDVAAFR